MTNYILYHIGRPKNRFGIIIYLKVNRIESSVDTQNTANLLIHNLPFLFCSQSHFYFLSLPAIVDFYI